MGEDFADISPSPIFGLLLSETFPVLIAYLCQYLSKHVWDLSGVYCYTNDHNSKLFGPCVPDYWDYRIEKVKRKELLGLNRIEKVERKDADTGGTCSQLLGLQKLRKGEKKGCRHRRHLCRERYAENVPECASDYIANQHHHPPWIIVKLFRKVLRHLSSDVSRRYIDIYICIGYMLPTFGEHVSVEFIHCSRAEL